MADSISSVLTTIPRAERAETVPRSAATAPTCTSCSTRPRESRGSDDELIVTPCHVDLARFLQRADHADHAGLGLFDSLQLGGTEQLDLFREVRGGALG